MNREQWTNMAASLAQAAVNITEGKYNTFEPGSRVARALEEFCRAANEGEIGPVPAASSLPTWLHPEDAQVDRGRDSIGDWTRVLDEEYEPTFSLRGNHPTDLMMQVLEVANKAYRAGYASGQWAKANEIRRALGAAGVED